MRALRPLFANPPRPDGLAPIYLALLALVVTSAMGFGVALWPRESVAQGLRPQDAERAKVSCPVDGGELRAPATIPAPAPVRRSDWM